MPYARDLMAGRIIHDADSHLMELPDCLDPYLDAKYRAAYNALPKLAKREEGYVETATPDDADLIVLNTCHIREKAAEKVYSELGRMRVL